MTGTFVPIQDYGTAVVLGVVRNTNNSRYERQFVYGLNPAVSAGSEGIWGVGAPFEFLTAPEPVRVRAGGSAQDSTTGLGARTIIVRGLDSNLQLAEEVISLAGSAASAPTSTSFWRVNTSQVLTNGLYGGVCAANITIEGATSGKTLDLLTRGVGFTQKAFYSVPIDYTALIYDVILYVQEGSQATLFFHVREGLDQVAGPNFPPALVLREFASVTPGAWTFKNETPTKIEGGSDFYVLGASGVGTFAISISFELVLVPNK